MINAGAYRLEDPSRTKAQSALGRIQEERGAYNEAVQTLDETIRLQSANTSKMTTDLSESTNELATAHYYLGHLALADSLYKRALAMDRQLYGAVHPRVADDFCDMGLVQHDLGNDHQAEQDYRQALQIKAILVWQGASRHGADYGRGGAIPGLSRPATTRRRPCSKRH